MSNASERRHDGDQAPDTSQATQATERSASAALQARRRLLKAGVIAAPLILTFKARPVLGQMGNNISGLSGASKPTP